MESELKKLKDSEVSIAGEIPVEIFEQFRPKAIKNIGEHTEIPGFRKGKVPEQVLVQKLGEEKILYEMAERALQDAYPALVAKHKIDPIGRPVIAITKIAKGNPLGFSITVAVMPEITLPDYKNIARRVATEKEEPVVVEEKEISDAIENLRKQFGKTKGATKTSDEKNVSAAEDLPAFDDAFAKSLGEYRDVADFKEKLKEHLKNEKGMRARSKKRMRIIEGILAGTNIEVPKIIAESELDTMITQFKGDIAQMGAKFEDYLKHIGKTEEEIRKEFAPDAQKRAKTELILHKISSLEHLAPSHEEIEKEAAHLEEHYRDADPVRVRAYVQNVLTNERVLQFLENQK